MDAAGVLYFWVPLHTKVFAKYRVIRNRCQRSIGCFPPVPVQLFLLSFGVMLAKCSPLMPEKIALTFKI